MLQTGSQQGNWKGVAAWSMVGSSQKLLWMLWSARTCQGWSLQEGNPGKNGDRVKTMLWAHMAASRACPHRLQLTFEREMTHINKFPLFVKMGGTLRKLSVSRGR